MSTEPTFVPGVSTPMIEFTPDMVRDLSQAQKKAVAEGLSSFIWRTHEFDTRYAHYLVEYLSTKMGLTNV